MRKEVFYNEEYYHIYNRGNNKRNVVLDRLDLARFLRSMREFNSVEPVGSLWLNALKPKDQLRSSTSQLVEFVCFCLNPNHYHLLIKQLADDGIKNFMHRLGTGYTKYFNEKHKNSGSLFQGRYKAVHVNSNEYLLYLSAYINLNFKIHELRSSASQYLSSWDEYRGKIERGLCNKKIILSQFNNFSDYEMFAVDAYKISRTRKDMEKLLLEEN